MFDQEALRKYCLEKKAVSESFPFGPETLVFKVLDKVFLLTGVDGTEFRFNVKMDPELIPEYRDKYIWIQPGYHMNKNHWNTIIVGNTTPLKLLLWIIDHSYEQVVKGLSKKDREKL